MDIRELLNNAKTVEVTAHDIRGRIFETKIFEEVFGKEATDLFKLFLFESSIDELKVILSVRNYGTIYMPIIDEDGYVIDGMSRIKALIALSSRFTVRRVNIKCTESRDNIILCTRIAIEVLKSKIPPAKLLPFIHAVAKVIPDIETSIINYDKPISVERDLKKINDVSEALNLLSRKLKLNDDLAKLSLDYAVKYINDTNKHKPNIAIAAAAIETAMMATCNGRWNTNEVERAALDLGINNVSMIRTIRQQMCSMFNVNYSTIKNACINRLSSIIKLYGCSDSMLSKFDEVIKVVKSAAESSAVLFYLSCNDKVTQRDAATVFGVSDVTIRSWIKRIKPILMKETVKA